MNKLVPILVDSFCLFVLISKNMNKLVPSKGTFVKGSISLAICFIETMVSKNARCGLQSVSHDTSCVMEDMTLFFEKRMTMRTFIWHMPG